jgi:hypothetical protein
MTEPVLIHARFKPLARPWTDLRQNMPLEKMFLMGITSGEICGG